MSDDRITPRKMLAFYRANAPMHFSSQIAGLNKLPVSERLELLLYMALYTGATVQTLQEKLEPGSSTMYEGPSEVKGN